MSPKAPRHKIGRWIAGAGILALLYSLLSGPHGLINIYRFKREAARIRSEIELQRAAADSLTTEVNRLNGDTAYLERLARERLGMARKDEKVYKFVHERK